MLIFSVQTHTQILLQLVRLTSYSTVMFAAVMLQMSLLWVEKEEVDKISGERNKLTSRNRNQSKDLFCMCAERVSVQTHLLLHRRRKTQESDERYLDVLHAELAATKTGNVSRRIREWGVQQGSASAPMSSALLHISACTQCQPRATCSSHSSHQTHLFRLYVTQTLKQTHEGLTEPRGSAPCHRWGCGYIPTVHTETVKEEVNVSDERTETFKQTCSRTCSLTCLD